MSKRESSRPLKVTKVNIIISAKYLFSTTIHDVNYNLRDVIYDKNNRKYFDEHPK